MKNRKPSQQSKKPKGASKAFSNQFMRHKKVPSATTRKVMRLNKFVAHAGICSRRAAVELVKNGSVKVNGEVVTEPGYEVLPTDTVLYLDKEIIPEANQVYVLLNKPVGYITSVTDDRGRPVVMDLLKTRIEERIFPVGRLDMYTTGVLILTNDGEMTKRLTHPSHEVKKIYEVTLNKDVNPADLERISQGIELEEGIAKVDKVSYIDGRPKNEVGLEVHIGWNRVIRRIFEKLGYVVNKLDRPYFAGIHKRDLGVGKYRFLTEKEIVMLKHFS